MKRKINLVGQNTLTVSLPSKWVKQNHLKKGDELEILANNKELILKSDQILEKQEINIDLRKVKSVSTLNAILTKLFLNGYKRIEVRYEPKVKANQFYKQEEIDTMFAIERFTHNCIGLEITEDKPGLCVLEEIINLDKTSFINSFRRGFLLLLEFAEQINNLSEKTSKGSAEQQQEYDFLPKYYVFDRFFKHAIKSLKYSDFEQQKIESYAILINNIQLMSYAYAIYGTMPNKSKGYNIILKEVNQTLRLFYEQCFNPELGKLDELAYKINEIQEKILKSKTNDTALLNIINIMKLTKQQLITEEIIKTKTSG